MKKLLVLLFAVLISSVSLGQINVTGSTGADGTYTALTTAGGAFAAINAANQSGANIIITVTADVTTEDGAISLDAGNWISLTIRPGGGAARSISGNVAAPLISFNGADYVIIDGLNTGGNSLVISNLSTSLTSSTSTIKLFADATYITITNCSVFGSATVPLATNGGNIYIGTGTTTGNDNITISNCIIGPAGTNLPSKGIYANGSTTSSAIANSNITINNCEIFDYRLGSGCAGIYALTGNTDWTISNNKIYQTVPLPMANTMNGIYFSNPTYGNNIQITDNTIGFADNAGTGVLTLTGTGSFRGIYLSAMNTAPDACNINNNIISDISLTSSSGTFYGINNGSSASSNTININDNFIKNITLVTTTGACYGISWGSATNMNITGNDVYNITRNGAGPLYGIYSGTSSTNENVSNNNVHDLSATSTATTSLIYGIYQLTASGTKTFQNNTIYNLSGAYGNAIYGLYVAYGTTVDISNNTIYSLAATGGTASTIGGIYVSTSATTMNVYKNKIYDLSSSSSGANVFGIVIGGGTTRNIYNNLIGHLEATASDDVDAIRGINIISTTVFSNINVYFNTVYINATSSGTNFGTTGIYHATNSTATTAALDLRNNIIVNTSTPNGTGVTAAYRRSSTTLTNYSATSNYNLFYAGTPGINKLIFYDGINSDQTLSAFKTRVSPRDASSISESPHWLSVNGSDPTFLHIDQAFPTLIESGGENISTITTDFDGDTRNANTPDIGADEFNGTSPGPDIILNSITPSGPQCTASPRNISVDVTTSTGTITGVTITYNNGTAVGPVAMTNSLGNTWIFTIPAASPTNTLVTWSITATNSVPITKIYNGASYQDDPLFDVTLSASVSDNLICPGNAIDLSVNLSSTAAAPAYTPPPPVNFPTVNEDLGNITITDGTIAILDNSSTINTLDGTIGTPSGNAGSYSDYTSFGPFMLMSGQAYNFSASTLQGTNAFGNAIGIYIDYNRNGVFTDTGEDVYVSSATTSGAHTETGTFTVPSGASAGNTRMRIVANEGLVTGPAMNVSYGEYEEYTMNIMSNAAITTYSWSDGTNIVGTTNPLTLSPSASATYTCTSTVFGCPLVSDGAIVTVSTGAVINTQPVPLTLCEGQDATFTIGAVGPSITYVWRKGGIDINNILNPSAATATLMLTNVSSGDAANYDCIITASCGDPDTSNAVTLTVNQIPTSGTLTNFPVCEGSTLSLTGVTDIGTSFSWTGPNGFTSTSQNPVITNVTFAASGTYYFTTSANGCSATPSSSTVIVNPTPSVPVITPPSAVLCMGTIQQLTVSGDPNATFTWSPLTDLYQDAGATNAYTGTDASSVYAMPLADITYTATATSTSGCTSTANVTIDVVTVVLNSGTDTTLCSDQSVTLDAGAGFDSYLWSNNATSQTITIDTLGIGDGTFSYYVTVTLGLCSATDSLHVTFTSCTGLNENTSDASVDVFPNPTNGKTTVVIRGFDSDAVLSILNLEGQAVYNEKISGSSTQQLDLSYLSAGVYVMKIVNDKHSRLLKLIIQR